MSAPEYLIDSNVFIRHFVRDNAKMSAECTEFIAVVQREPLPAVTSALVLAEVQWVLGSFYAFPKPRVVEALKSIIRFADQNADMAMATTAAALYEGHNVKFIDALIASHPRVQDGSMTVVSYDKDFDVLGVKRLEPREVLRKIRA